MPVSPATHMSCSKSRRFGPTGKSPAPAPAGGPTRSDGQWRAAQGRGDRRDGGKVGKRDAQSLPAHEQHKYACLPPLLTASTSESWCNRCSRARHHLSMECAHNANGMEGTKVRRCTNLITAPVQWGRNVRPRGP